MNKTMSNILPDFQKYLMENKLATEGHVSFYALWASRFLSFSNRHQDKAIELRKGLFLDSLTKKQKLQDWQVNQADNAIGLYLGHNSGDSIRNSTFPYLQLCILLPKSLFAWATAR